MHTETSDNTTPPFFGPEHAVYPQVDQTVRVYAPALVGTNVYPAFMQQFVPPLGLRDREPVYLYEPNLIALGPGYYLARLVSNYAGLPLLATTCCPIGNFSSSSASSGSSSSSSGG